MGFITDQRPHLVADADEDKNWTATMNLRWLWVCLSAFALVGGFGVLLLFINSFAVPHMLTGEFQPTLCKLALIKIIPMEGGQQKRQNCNSTNCIEGSMKTLHNTSLTTKKAPEKGEAVNEARSQLQEIYQGSSHEALKRSDEDISPSNTSSLNVRDHKKNGDSIIGEEMPVPSMEGFKHKRAAQGVTLVTVSAITNVSWPMEEPQQDYCVSLQVSYRKLDGGIVQNAQVFDTPWSYYSVIYGTEKVDYIMRFIVSF